jgi:hypothetical protein
MKPILKKTNKLFFKKWPFKVTVIYDHASFIRRYNNKLLTNIASGKFAGYRSFGFKEANSVIVMKIQLASWAEDYQFHTRSEGRRLSFFTNDEAFVEILKDEFKNKVVEIVAPENQESLELLKNNVNIVICEKLPKKNLRYRVYLDGKYSIPSELSENFYRWCEKYNDKISIPYGLKYYLKAQRDFKPLGNYFYTSDEKILSMALMFLGKHVQYTEKFVLKSEINE